MLKVSFDRDAQSSTEAATGALSRGSAPHAMRDMSRSEALLSLLGALRRSGYEFVTPTPSTHGRVIARADRQQARELRDVLGWSLPFSPEIMPGEILELLERAEVVREQSDGLLASTIRVSTVRGAMFIHSAYPTTAEDSVFLGPDSYRFADLIAARAPSLSRGARILDYGAGAGVGGITAALANPGATLTLADINPRALFLASINARFADIDFELAQTRSPDDAPGEFDLFVTHPPFMMDSDKRAYRDGGDLYGAQLSLDWILAGMRKLRSGGTLVLHTGVSIVAGRDVLLDALRHHMPAMGWQWDYHELDPDIFGDELDKPAYADVERIAAVGMWATRTADGAIS